MTGFDVSDLVFGAFRLGVGLVPLLAVGVGVLLWWRTRAPKVPASVAPAVAEAGYDPGRLPERPVGQWRAQVSAGGSFVMPHTGMGTLRLENGWVGFHPGAPTEPALWMVPATHVRAGKNSILARQEVWLESPQTGRLNLTVSHEHINQFMRNDLKDLRERGYADELLWLLAQSGAQVAPGR